MSDSHRNIDEIFLAALQKQTPSERSQYLDEVCAGDPEFRQQVERLLNAHPKAEKFMESPVAQFDPTISMSDILERPGATIGRYKLLQKIGEGGFGIVFMAEQQEPVVRKVALKVIKPGMDTRQIVARFEAERQALALMDHPNIANVLDAGATDSGRPYFIMELVKGIPCTEFCEQNDLTIAERLSLFLSVCQAVHHAHQKGIVHRDLKPTNILVTLHDGKPVVKVIDFGVAKALNQRLTERTLFTEFGQVVGTPLYMSPEQAEMSGLDVDTRSDIFSLGVLLYEFLTGSTPLDRKRFQKAALREVRRIIREEEPPKPSTKISRLGQMATEIAKHRKTDPKKLSSLLYGDLDWIVMKALEKDRGRRYETAKDFADDVIRHMEHKVVEAGPPSTTYRFGKFVRRNRAVVTVASVIALSVLVSFLGVSTGLIYAVNALKSVKSERDRAVRAENNAGREAAKARVQAERANRSDLLARTTLADMYVTQGLTADMLGNPAEAVLWFANAASASQHDPYRTRANRVRIMNWRRQCIETVRAFQAPPGQFGRQIVFDPSGRFVYVDGRWATKTVVFDVETEERVDLPGKRDFPTTSAWSPAGDFLAVDSEEGVSLFNVPDFTISKEIPFQGRGRRRLAYSKCGRYLAISDSRVRIWDCKENRYAFPELMCKSKVVRLVFDASSKNLAIACEDGFAYVLRLQDGDQPVLAANGPIPNRFHIWVGRKRAFEPVFLENDTQILTLEGSRRIVIRNLADGTISGELPSPKFGVSQVASLPAKNLLVACGLYDVAIWDLKEKEIIVELRVSDGVVNGMSFSPDGTRLLTSSAGGAVRLWAIPSGELLSAPIEHQPRPVAVAYSPSGTSFASVQNDGVLRVWRQTTELKHHEIPTGSSHRSVLSEDGAYIASAGFWMGNGRLTSTRVHSVLSGQPVGSQLDVGCLINGATFSPDEHVFVTFSASPEHFRPRHWHILPGLVTAWDWRTGRKIFETQIDESEPVAGAFMSDGKHLLVACAGGDVVTLDVLTGQIRRKWHHGRPRRWSSGSQPQRWLIESPDKDRIAILDGFITCSVWDAKTGRLCYEVKQGGYAMKDADFSKDGKWLVTGCDDGIAQVRDARTGKKAGPPLKHPDWVFSTRFSGDGAMVLTGCRDHSARLWDWRSNQLVCPALEHDDEVYCATMTLDDQWICTACKDGTVGAWEYSTGMPVYRSIRTIGQARSVTVGSNGRYAAVAGDKASLSLIDLSDLLTADAPSLAADDTRLYAELLAGRRVLGAGRVRLSSEEWMTRWRDFRARHPEFHDPLIRVQGEKHAAQKEDAH